MSSSNDFVVTTRRQVARPLGPFLLTLYTLPVLSVPQTQPAIAQPLHQSVQRVTYQTSARKTHILTLLTLPVVSPQSNFTGGLDVSFWPKELFVKTMPREQITLLLNAPVLVVNLLQPPLLYVRPKAYFPGPLPAQIGVSYGYMLERFTFPVYVPPPPPPPPPPINLASIPNIRFTLLSDKIRFSWGFWAGQKVHCLALSTSN